MLVLEGAPEAGAEREYSLGDAVALAKKLIENGERATDAAKEAALADAAVEAEGHVRGRYTEKDGTGIYKVTFKAGGQRYKYRIDAMTGEILEKSVTEIVE